MPIDLLAQPKDLLERQPIDLLDKTAPKQSFFDNLINTGSEIVKDIPAQIQDLMNIPAALLGTPRPAMKSKLATETVPYIMEKATTPIGDVPIKTLSYNDVRNMASGRFTYTESQVSPSLVDIGFYGLMGASMARNQLALARWNNQLNKLIKTEEVRGAVMNNMESFEVLMTQAGVKMEGMDLTAKTDFVLSQAKSSPKLGTAIMDLVSGKIVPKAQIAGQPTETGAVVSETPIVAPKQPITAPIAPKAVENPLPLAIRLKSGEVITDTTAKLHSDIVTAKGINPDDVVDVGIMKGTEYQATKLPDTKGGEPLDTLPKVPEELMNKVKGMVEENNPVKKIVEALKGAGDLRGQQETLYKKARGEKLAKMSAVGKKTSGEKGFFAEKGALKGELPKVEFESIRNKLKQEDIDSLFNMVKESPHLTEWDKLTAREGLANLLGETGGKVPTESEIKKLHKVFGKELTEALLEKRPMLEKIKAAGLQLANMPKSIMSSFDLSFGLRQGAFTAPRYRKQFFDSWTKQFSWFGSEKAFTESMKLVSENPNYNLAIESGVAFTEMDSLIGEREERFASQWADVIPGVRASSRAYTGFANKYRMDLFDTLIKDAEELGLKPQTNADLTKKIADFVNNSTGRGSLGDFESSATALNAFFFSPRLMASRVKILTKMFDPRFYTKEDPFIRKEFIKTMLTYLGTGLTILGVAKLMGAEVGNDVRSSDLGKIKIGNTRIDIWSGFQPYIRMVGQLISGEYVSSTTKKVLTLGEGYKPLTRLDILMRQVESKEAPTFSLITELLKGQDFEGKPINISKELALRFVPMVIQDLYDVIKDNPEATPAVMLAPFGVGVQTYKGRKKVKF